MRLGARQKGLLGLLYSAFAILAVAVAGCYFAGLLGNGGTKEPDPALAGQRIATSASPTPDRPARHSGPAPSEPSRWETWPSPEPASLPVGTLPGVDPSGGVAPTERRHPGGSVDPGAGLYFPDRESPIQRAQYVTGSSPGSQLRVRPPESPDPTSSGPLPVPTGSEPTLTIPIASPLPPGAVQVDARNGLVSMVVRDAPLNEVLGILAQNQGLNLITAEDVTARVSVTLTDVPFERALTHILSVAGYTWIRQENVLIITSVTEGGKHSPYAQGREVRVFALDHVSATDVDLVIQGLLSPAGQSFIVEGDEADDRKTQELLIVEDLPAYLGRIEQYVQQVDVPSRQVLIEVHVMGIELEDDHTCGINLDYLSGSVVPSLTLRTQGFADAKAFAAGTTPAFYCNIVASELNALIELIETTTDAKTLATPKVLALNGQKARIQIGDQLSYRVTTTTQTSSQESVEFMDVGVVLEVTSRITKDNNVIMYVRPEISSGDYNPKTDLPEKETTEVETSVMLPDGHGMLIGGLIQEEDVESESKVPVIGDLWLIGRLFQQHTVERKRTEIIIALIPHVVPYCPGRQERECEQFYRATTPLLYGPLLESPRQYEPRFPNAGQRLPLRYKTQHLHTIPDCGGWAPHGSHEPCMYGPPGAFPPYRDAMSPPRGDLEPRDAETIPTPPPAPTR